jgi:hypothetical protein
MTKKLTKAEAYAAIKPYVQNAQPMFPEFMPVRGFGSNRAERWYIGRVEAGGKAIVLVALAANEAHARSLIDRMGAKTVAREQYL